MRSSELRSSFLTFFEQVGHRVLPGSSLVPEDDPTLLYINAGMNQFKKVFLGEQKRPHARVATVQKCLRVSGKHNDLEEVGRDEHHHTFFEMLGNWSFDDYYKAEAIEFAWNYLTEVLGLESDKLWATVHKDDEDALRLWPHVTGMPSTRVLKFGDKDNFWEMGEIGPCGPCTEIHYDFGPARGPGRPESGPNDSSSNRWIELWNLVFIQYSRKPDGSLEELPNKYVDTGMGFERLLALLQGVPGNYGTDLFSPIMDHLGLLTGKKHGDKTDQVAFRAIADHIRALTFAISDGVVPSNEGRGYVLRRILRRAARYGREMGLDEPFLHLLSADVVKIMGVDYPELEGTISHVAEIIEAEEIGFGLTLDRGLALFQKERERLFSSGKKTIPGEVIFKLYDTYGFPADLTRLMAEEQGMRVAMQGFHELMELRRESSRRASASHLMSEASALSISTSGERGLFVGYEELEVSTEVLTTDPMNGIDKGHTGWGVLAKCPFYPESGGQIHDSGRIVGEGMTATVLEVVRNDRQGVVVKMCIEEGRLRNGARITASVDMARRIRVQAHHTATHLLHAALRKILGSHVKQAGSLVASDRLRFDFNHFRAVSRKELEEIQKMVNEWVDADIDVKIQENVPIDEARAAGALAFFGEKYGDAVRVVDVPGISVELCGGTHMNRTSRVGPFRLFSEAGIAAGVRRIEAVSGGALLDRSVEFENKIGNLGRILGGGGDEIEDRAKKIKERVKELEKEVSASKAALHEEKLKGMETDALETCGATVIGGRLVSASRKELRHAADILRGTRECAVVVLASEDEETIHLLIAVTDDLISRGVHAGRLVSELAERLGGRGGGRPHLAEAGAKVGEMGNRILNNLPVVLAGMVEKVLCS